MADSPPKPVRRKRQISVYLSSQAAAMLDAKARATGLSRSDFVTLAINLCLIMPSEVRVAVQDETPRAPGDER